MPLYTYQSIEPDNPQKSCRICACGFELRRPVSRPELEFCPLCKNPVRKVITSVFSPRILKPLSTTRAKDAGFTVLQRLGSGEYEKL